MMNCLPHSTVIYIMMLTITTGVPLINDEVRGDKTVTDTTTATSSPPTLSSEVDKMVDYFEDDYDYTTTLDEGQWSIIIMNYNMQTHSYVVI